MSNKRYLLALLLLVSLFNFTDHMIFALLMQSIKEDLFLSDTQLGLLSGLAFAVFYCTLGIPIARWADRGNRITIISISVAIFSAMTALCGLATGFTQLLLFRIGVGAGEAGCTPSSHSLISDYFSRANRAKAMSIYMMGAPLGMLVGYLVGGWVNELYGWRIVFLVLGVPGVILGVIVKLTLRDPRENLAVDKLSSQQEAQAVVLPSIAETLRALYQKRTFRHLTIALSLLYFVGYGTGQWQPAFFMRTHAMNSGELGIWLALTSGIGGTIGVWLGGYLTTRYAAQRETLQLRALAFLGVVYVLTNFGVYLWPAKYPALWFLALVSMIGMLGIGPLYALVQGLVEVKARAMAVAILYFIINIVGLGLGPLFVGMLSDLLLVAFGGESLRIASLAVMPIYLWGSWHLLLAAQSVKVDLAKMEIGQFNSSAADPVDGNLALAKGGWGNG